MALDGKTLAAARDRLAEIKRDNEKTADLRRREVCGKYPEIKAVDARLKSLMAKVIGAAMANGEDPKSAVEDIAAESLELQARRSEMLVERGYPADYLEEIYNCKKCRDSGYVMGRMCSCLRRLYDEEAARGLSKLYKLGDAGFDSFDLNYYSDEPDGRLGCSPRECMEMVYEYCLNYALRFGKDSPSLLFRGSTGLGKTFLSACIARVVSGKGVSVVYETASAVIDAYEKTKFSRFDKDGEAAAEEVRRLEECQLLILDDLGTEMTTTFSVSAIYTLINSRLISGKQTIVSTNLFPTELEKRYGAQIASRLEGEYFCLTFAGTDIRAARRDNRIFR